MIQSSTTQQPVVRKSPSLSDAPLCVHLGLPKTATTMLQGYLYANHSQLNSLGKFESPDIDCFPDPTIKKLIRSVITVNKPFPNRAIDNLRQKIQAAAKSGKTSIFSKEGWCGLSKDKRDYLTDLLQQITGKCRVLLTVREPLSFVESLYFQQLKGFQKGKVPNLTKTFRAPPRYFDINQWLQALSDTSCLEGTLINKLRYADTADYYASVFGKDLVKVLVFEQLKSSPEVFIGELSDFLEIDADEAFSLSQNKRVNERWTEASINQLRKLQNSFVSRWRYRSKDDEGRRQMLGIDTASQAASSKKAKAEINNKFRKMILDITREQSRRIEKDWGLPLSQYGYDC